MFFAYFQGCNEGDVRLVDGNTALEGRVEVCMDNAWGTVCTTGWNSADAQVVCRQLGLSPTGIHSTSMFIAYSLLPLSLPTGALNINAASFFGQGTGTIVLSNVQCVGGERRLVDCRRQELSERHCSYQSQAGVRCRERTG